MGNRNKVRIQQEWDGYVLLVLSGEVWGAAAGAAGVVHAFPGLPLLGLGHLLLHASCVSFALGLLILGGGVWSTNGVLHLWR